MAIAALHRTLKNLMMERQIKLVLCFAVATYAELRLVHLQELQCGVSGLLCVRVGHENV